MSSYQRPKSYEMDQALYAKLLSVPGNEKCVDCGKLKPDWGSPKLGILFCVECSGCHRGLGTHISFVRSVHMDNWTAREMELMFIGGNRNCNLFLRKHGIHTALKPPTFTTKTETTGGSIHTHAEKYDSDAAELYRQILKARVQGLPEPTELPSSPTKNKYNMNGKPMQGFGSNSKYVQSSSMDVEGGGECCTPGRVICFLVALPIVASVLFLLS